MELSGENLDNITSSSQYLYLGNTAGTNERLLLNRAAGPSWSPDGRYLYIYAEAGIDQQVRGGVNYAFPAMSNGIARFTTSPMPANVEQLDLFQPGEWKFGTARMTSASPVGGRVAYDGRPSGGYRIFFLNGLDGQPFPFQFEGEQPYWSPNGEQVVYRSGRGGTTGIWISNWQASGHTNITNNGSDAFPAWSPDGRTIAFSRDEGGNVDIYTMNVDGSNQQRLTTAPAPDTLPVFAPDGSLVFRSARSGSWGIWKMSGSGGNQTQIIANAPVGPDWSYSKMDVR